MDAATITDVAAVGGWIVVTVAAAVVATQHLGWARPGPLVVVQSLTPHLVGLLAMIGLLAAATDRPVLGLSAAVVGLGGWLTVLATVRPQGHGTDAACAPALRVAAVNLLYSSPRITDVGVALAAVDADLIVFTELTPEHSAALHAHDVADRYPHRCEHPGEHAVGIGVWSRLPLAQKRRPDSGRGSLDVAIASGPCQLRLIAVHPVTPVEDVDLWHRGLAEIRAHVSGIDEPLLVIGDFNATYWHPPFRTLLTDGLADAHVAHGRGLSASWPTGGLIPPFVRLDHALVGNGLVSTGTVDFEVPGSDHRGFVVSVVDAARVDREAPAMPARGGR